MHYGPRFAKTDEGAHITEASCAATARPAAHGVIIYASASKVYYKWVRWRSLSVCHGSCGNPGIQEWPHALSDSRGSSAIQRRNKRQRPGQLSFQAFCRGHTSMGSSVNLSTVNARSFTIAVVCIKSIVMSKVRVFVRRTPISDLQNGSLTFHTLDSLSKPHSIARINLMQKFKGKQKCTKMFAVPFAS